MKTHRHILKGITLAATALLSMYISGTAIAGDRDPLLDVLISKGILTPQEADQVQQEVLARQQRHKKPQDKTAPETRGGLKINVLGFVDYSAGEKGGTGDTQSGFNHFTLTRGYLTIQKAIQPWLGARLTTDIHQDGDGSWLTRIKYLYAEIAPPDCGLLTGMKAEIGQGHAPWLDFEEHVNTYRAQGTMAIERAGVFNSADLGLNLRGDFGGKLGDAKARTGNSHYNGRYGSWHVGVYNGGGYHAAEANGNKVIEGRLTWRPLPDALPGLQFSYLGLNGKGNRKNGDLWPDFIVNQGMISYEHSKFIFTAQYFTTKGNAAGTWVNAGNEALDTAGYSFFGTYRLPAPAQKLAAFARHDHFDADDNNDMAADATYSLYMGGLAYDIYKGNMVLLNYERTSYGADSGGKGKAPAVDNNLGDDHRVQVVYQLKF